MAKNEGAPSLIEFMDIVFTAGGEMIPDNGEDSYMFTVNEKNGITAVFDGCGGLGSRKYAEYSGKTGAYISSRITARATRDWFEYFCAQDIKISKDASDAICSTLKEAIIEKHKKYIACTKAGGIKGSMTKSFPTTASIILFSNNQDVLCASYIWAGDSRGYLLTPRGLVQITKDDIETEGDALQNISDDGKLTNVVSAEGDFTLNSKTILCKKSGILVTATDGCFGYFATPMEFEFMLLSTLAQSSNAEQWKEKIGEYIKKYTADDYTIGIVAFGYGSFKRMKKAYADRYKQLNQKYISKLKKADQDEINRLWSEYKQEYYRGTL